MFRDSGNDKKTATFFDPKAEAEVRRKRAMAAQLFKQGEQPSQTEVVSGVAVKQSPLAAMAKALSTGVAGYAEGKADELETADAVKRQEQLAQAVNMYGVDKQGAIDLLMQSPATAEYGLKLGIPELSLGADKTPSAVQEYGFFNQLPPAEQARYLQMKRADKFFDTGGGFSRVNPITNEASPVTAPAPIMADGTTAPPQPLIKTLPPEKQPQNVEEDIKNKLRVEELYKLEQNIPNVEAKVNSAIKQIEAVKNDPSLPASVGTVSSKLPNIFGSTADFENKIKQLQGGAFLEAYQSLKGGGAITEVEGAKAEQAIARMQLSASEAGFKAALDDFKSAVAAGLKRQQDRIKELKGQSYSLPTLNEGAIDATPTGSVDPDIGAILGGFNPSQTQPKVNYKDKYGLK
jgi:hypothetical protein